MALAHRTVTGIAGPAAGVTIRGHVYRSACLPELQLFTSETSDETDAEGNYTLLLHSNDQTSGQCLVLHRSDTGDSVAVSLASLPFSARFPEEEPRDSILIDLAAE